MKHHGPALIAAMLIAWTRVADAQVTCAAPAPTVLQANTPIAVPTDKAFDMVGVFHVGTQKLAPLTLTGPISAGQWTPTPEDVTQLAALDAADNRLVWLVKAVPGDLACQQEISVAEPGQEPEESATVPIAREAAATESTDWSVCIDKSERWRSDIMQSRRHDKKDFTLIVFYEDQGPCYTNRDYGVVGDPIYIGVFTDGSTRWGAARYEPCEIEPAGVRLYIAPGGFPNVKEARRKERELEKRAPRTCYNTALQVGVKGRRAGAEVENRLDLAQSQRYHGTLQLGVVFTEQHDREFGLRPEAGESVIFDKGPTDEGPEFTASVVIYSLPKSLISLAQGRFPGRDIVHEQGVLDRIGGIIGVGLTDPGDRFIAGLSFELFSGLNVSYVQDFAKVTRLAGVSENDPFAGTQDEIPTRKVWRNHSYVGLGLDLRYVVAMFSHQ